MRRELRILAIGLALVPATAGAETARAILDQVIAHNRERRPEDIVQTLRMTHSVEGRTIFTREMETWTKLYPDDTSKIMTFFIAPADIKGVSFLGWHDPRLDDVQWLYLPKLRRVRQIGPQARQRSFEGTVFTYEDLELFEEMTEWGDGESESRLVERRELHDGVPCVVIDIVPRSHMNVTYGRFRVWIHRPDATLRRTDLFYRDEQLFKRALFSDWKTVEQIPVAHRIELADVRRDVRTALEVEETRLNQGLDEEQFTPMYLERASR